MKSKAYKPVSFWKPGKINKKPSNPLFHPKYIPMQSKVRSVHSPSPSPSPFTPKFIQPVKLKKYPTRTKSERRLIDKNPWGDKDKDGVPNIFDCRPMNRKKQDKMTRRTAGKLVDDYFAPKGSYVKKQATRFLEKNRDILRELQDKDIKIVVERPPKYKSEGKELKYHMYEGERIPVPISKKRNDIIIYDSGDKILYPNQEGEEGDTGQSILSSLYEKQTGMKYNRYAFEDGLDHLGNVVPEGSFGLAQQEAWVHKDRPDVLRTKKAKVAKMNIPRKMTKDEIKLVSAIEPRPKKLVDWEKSWEKNLIAEKRYNDINNTIDDLQEYGMKVPKKLINKREKIREKAYGGDEEVITLETKEIDDRFPTKEEGMFFDNNVAMGKMKKGSKEYNQQIKQDLDIKKMKKEIYPFSPEEIEKTVKTKLKTASSKDPGYLKAYEHEMRLEIDPKEKTNKEDLKEIEEEHRYTEEDARQDYKDWQDDMAEDMGWQVSKERQQSYKEEYERENNENIIEDEKEAERAMAKEEKRERKELSQIKSETLGMDAQNIVDTVSKENEAVERAEKELF
jgi:hypothetical protein